MTHYLQVGACPLCGAPLFAAMTDPATGASLYDTTSGLWSAIPAITYTCDHHAQLTLATGPEKEDLA